MIEFRSDGFVHFDFRRLPIERSNGEISLRTNPAGESQLGVDAISRFDRFLSIRFVREMGAARDDFEATASAGAIFTTGTGDRETDFACHFEQRHLSGLDLERPSRRQKTNLALHDGGSLGKASRERVPLGVNR